MMFIVDCPTFPDAIEAGEGDTNDCLIIKFSKLLFIELKLSIGTEQNPRPRSDSLSGISFGFTSDGKPGYREAGADAVTPFSNFDPTKINLLASNSTSGVMVGYKSLSSGTFNSGDFSIVIVHVWAINDNREGYISGDISISPMVQKFTGNYTDSVSRLGIYEVNKNTNISASFTFYRPSNRNITLNIEVYGIA